MEGGLVTGPSSSEGSSHHGDAPFFDSYAKTFADCFPYYLSIGMTPGQYWDEDASLARVYREAEALRRERENQARWEQGAYFYQALCAASPIFHAFAKKGTRPNPYMSEPFPIGRQTARQKEQQALNQQTKRKVNFLNAMGAINRKFQEKGDKQDAGQH